MSLPITSTNINTSIQTVYFSFGDFFFSIVSMLIFYLMVNPLPSSILTHSPNTMHQLLTPR